MKKHRPGEIDVMYFDKLPPRCKELFFQFLNDSNIPEKYRANFCHVNAFYYDECESPIEVILNFAFDMVAFCTEGYGSSIYLIPQYEVVANGKNYRIDLFFDSNECESPFAHFKPYKLAIECDGHDYHEKTKAQVKKNNQRDLDLKMEGYDIIHFSGSQIYNEPLKCANDLIKYILLHVGGEHE